MLYERQLLCAVLHIFVFFFFYHSECYQQFMPSERRSYLKCIAMLVIFLLVSTEGVLVICNDHCSLYCCRFSPSACSSMLFYFRDQMFRALDKKTSKRFEPCHPQATCLNVTICGVTTCWPVLSLSVHYKISQTSSICTFETRSARRVPTVLIHLGARRHCASSAPITLKTSWGRPKAESEMVHLDAMPHGHFLTKDHS